VRGEHGRLARRDLPERGQPARRGRAGRLGSGAGAGCLAAHLVAAGHRAHVAEQRRIDDPGQLGAGMARPGVEQGRQAPGLTQIAGQVVAGQGGGAHFLLRLADERPEPGDLQRAGQVRHPGSGPEREQRLVGEITLPARSCSWAVTPYTPKLVMPWVSAWNDAVHESVAPGLRLAETKNGFPAAIRSLATPRDT